MNVRLVQDLTEQMQLRLRHEQEVRPDMYKPSPGQLPDHVHHRIARICAEVAEVALAEAVRRARDDGYEEGRADGYNQGVQDEADLQ